MEDFAPVLILVSILVAACSFIAIIRPISRLGLGSRKRALAVLGLSFITFVIGGIILPPQTHHEPPPELARNPEKTPNPTTKAPTPSNSNRDVTPAIATGDSSPQKGPQPKPVPNSKPGPRPAPSPEPEPAPAQEPEPEPAPTETNSSDKPVGTYTAHEYEIVETTHTSAGTRLRTQLRVYAPMATTPSALIATAMVAAVQAQKAHQSQHVRVFVHADHDPRSEILAQVNLAPDGCGVSGDDCTGDMWSSAKAVSEVPTRRQIAIYEEAKKSEDSFKKVVTHKSENDDFDILMEKVKPLYEELMLMKDEERFHTLGFSANGPYNRWLLDVRRLRDEADELELLRKWNIMVSDLLQMGFDYLRAKGSETRHTEDAREHFSLAFTSKRGESKRYENDEEALLQYLAKKFHSSPDEIEATILDTMSAYLGTRNVEIPDHMRNMGALTNEQQEDMTCRMDLQCWGDEHSIEATFACQSHIERLAQYTHEWTDGLLEAKFSHFRWSDRTKGVVTYMGDKIMFQNGYGAWVPHRYWCDYDALNKQALDVRAQAGRM